MGRNQQIQELKIGNQMRSPAAFIFLAITPTEGWSVVAVPAWAGLVFLEPPSLCRRLFHDEVAGAGLELLLELARRRFEPTSPAAGVHTHDHSSTHERCSAWLP